MTMDRVALRPVSKDQGSKDMARHCPPNAWGIITVTNQAKGSRHSQRQQTARPLYTTNQYVWRPSAAIRRELPQGFCQSFDCRTGTDRLRRFIPSAGLGTFLVEASLSGSVVLARRVNLGSQERLRYHEMRLVYQLGLHLREHFDRSFKKAPDLYLPRPGRVGEAHLLPDGLGNGPQGTGESWGPAELLERGRENAIAAGCNKPDQETCIRFGLLEAARRDPLDPDRLSETDALKIVRLALFDLGPAQNPIEEAQVGQVNSRLREALRQHIYDSTDDFNRWFFDSVDNLVHQMAKKKRPGGPIAREVVRQAILELVFEAYVCIGNTIHEFMWDFCRALPRKLSKKERSLFDLFYMKQSFFGGLPLVLLHDRYDFLQEVMLEILGDPQDRRLTGVLLRLLQYYGAMASRKREGDRQYKKQRLHRNADNRSALILPLSPQDKPTTEITGDLFQEIAAYLREKRKATCNCRSTLRWRARVIAEETTRVTVVLEDFCEGCFHTESVRLTATRFRKVGEQLRHGRDSQDC